MLITKSYNAPKWLSKQIKRNDGSIKERIEGTWKHMEKQTDASRKITFSREWAGHRFTDNEVDKLLDDRIIHFAMPTDMTNGKKINVYGKLTYDAASVYTSIIFFPCFYLDASLTMPELDNAPRLNDLIDTENQLIQDDNNKFRQSQSAETDQNKQKQLSDQYYSTRITRNKLLDVCVILRNNEISALNTMERRVALVQKTLCQLIQPDKFDPYNNDQITMFSKYLYILMPYNTIRLYIEAKNDIPYSTWNLIGSADSFPYDYEINQIMTCKTGSCSPPAPNSQTTNMHYNSNIRISDATTMVQTVMDTVCQNSSPLLISMATMKMMEEIWPKEFLQDALVKTETMDQIVRAKGTAATIPKNKEDAFDDLIMPNDNIEFKCVFAAMMLTQNQSRDANLNEENEQIIQDMLKIAMTCGILHKKDNEYYYGGQKLTRTCLNKNLQNIIIETIDHMNILQCLSAWAAYAPTLEINIYEEYTSNLKYVQSSLDKIIQKAINCYGSKSIYAEEIPIGSYAEEFQTQLNEMIGLNSVKKKVKQLVDTQKTALYAQQKGYHTSRKAPTLHLILTGNAGTGKTEVARLLGKIYTSMGVLKKDVFVEATRADLIAEYQGQTAPKVKAKFDEADGGILFIDEAYNLCWNSHDDFGLECINALQTELENRRNNIMVILAGYEEDMNKFLAQNQGFTSRFPETIHFEDYTIKELVEIFHKMITDQGMLLNGISDQLIADTINSIKNETRDFGNARGVRNIVDKVINNQNVRIGHIIDKGKDVNEEEYNTIIPEDMQI